MGRPRTPPSDPLVTVYPEILRALLERDGRPGAEIVRNLTRHVPPVEITPATLSNLSTGKPSKTRRSVRDALEWELGILLLDKKSVLSAEIPLSEAMHTDAGGRLMRLLPYKGDVSDGMAMALVIATDPRPLSKLLFGVEGAYSAEQRSTISDLLVQALTILFRGVPMKARRAYRPDHAVELLVAVGLPRRFASDIVNSRATFGTGLLLDGVPPAVDLSGNGEGNIFDFAKRMDRSPVPHLLAKAPKPRKKRKGPA